MNVRWLRTSSVYLLAVLANFGLLHSSVPQIEHFNSLSASSIRADKSGSSHVIQASAKKFAVREQLPFVQARSQPAVTLHQSIDVSCRDFQPVRVFESKFESSNPSRAPPIA